MTSKNIAVFGIYRTEDQAEHAVDTLVTSGFSSSLVSVLLPDTAGTRAFAHQKGTKAPEDATAANRRWSDRRRHRRSRWRGRLCDSRVGPFIAAGPIMADWRDSGSATVGGLLGALVGFGIPEYEAKR